MFVMEMTRFKYVLNGAHHNTNSEINLFKIKNISQYLRSCWKYYSCNKKDSGNIVMHSKQSQIIANKSDARAAIIQ